MLPMHVFLNALVAGAGASLGSGIVQVAWRWLIPFRRRFADYVFPSRTNPPLP